MLHNIVYRIAGDNWRGVPRPLCIELLVAHVGAANLRNRRTGKIAVCIPTFKCIAFVGHIIWCRQGCTIAVGIACYVLSTGNRSTVGVQRYYVDVRIPLCIELFVSYVSVADLHNRSAGKTAVRIPTIKCIALSGHIICCRQGCSFAIGIAYHIFSVSNRTTVCFQHYGISHRCPLRRQGSHTCRNICTRNIRIPIAALPAEISIRFPDWTGQAGTFGSREALTVFHNDIYRACGIANFPII